MIQLFLKGGPVMWPLLLTSITALAVVVERILFLIGESRRRDPEAIENVLKLVESGHPDEAARIGEESQDPVLQVISSGLEHRHESFTNAILRKANETLRAYNRGLSTLDTIITLAPLLGLLGTVTGMIRAFGLMGNQELGMPNAITGGIAEALIATAFGLAIAILALIPFNYLNTRQEEVRHEVEDTATQLEILLLGKR
ncbi:MAG: MotA/TolQ/ExbB proton channel family protein [Chthoniobacterales bacterium]